MISLVFATNNPNKQQEVQAKVGEAFKILSLADINCTHDIAETGVTLDENASIKSRYIFDNYQISCFGDDTGLEIEALDNQPGVYSARYGGTRDSEKNIDVVLQKMEGINNRNARFRTVISLILNQQEHIFEGIVNGTIRLQRSGTGGFGYDAIFEPNGYNITFAEMPLEEKNKISHRGLAIQKLIAFLQQL
ncbi:MAG: RdgB/HAM1 family non-canonical purine NTP pyrophosphatase [Sphingobacteriales bacterium]|nr:MAG: RdgB/HAM1 family non-canonical purine NTP pyrophosphatase [Sphingobacteriales bacterium]